MKQKILLIGDDGYTSLGIRLLAKQLKDDFDLVICAPKEQQSATGGKLTMKRVISWAETEVDRVKAIWVDGTPADCIEFAQSYFSERFDFIVSGINVGLNIGGHITSSGTFAAAWRGLVVKLAPKAISFSWDAPLSMFSTGEDLENMVSVYEAYPGNIAKVLVKKAIEENFWDGSILNVNFPQQPTQTALFTDMLPDLTQSDCYPNLIDQQNHTFSYPYAVSAHPNRDNRYDFGAVLAGKISITVCQTFPVDKEILKHVAGKELRL